MQEACGASVEHTFLARLAPTRFLRICADLAASEHVPRREGHALRADHGDDLALEVALENAPGALVDDKRRLAGEPGVCVSLGDDPSRCIGDSLQTGIQVMQL